MAHIHYNIYDPLKDKLKLPHKFKNRLKRKFNELTNINPLVDNDFNDYVLTKFGDAYYLSQVFINLTFALHRYYSEYFHDRDVVFIGRDTWPMFIVWHNMFDEKSVLLHISRYMVTAKDPLGTKTYTGILSYLYDDGLTDDYITLTKNPFYVKLDKRHSAFARYCRMAGLGKHKILVFDTGYRGTVSLFTQRILQKTLDVSADIVMLHSLNDFIPSLFETIVQPLDFSPYPYLKTLFNNKNYDKLINILESWPHRFDPVKGYIFDDYGNVKLVHKHVNEKDIAMAYLFYSALVSAIKDFSP